MNEMRTYWIWECWFHSAEWLEDIEHEFDTIEAAGQFDADSGDASRITPDPAGDDVTANDGRPVDEEGEFDPTRRDYYPHADLLEDVAILLTTRPKIFTAFRHYSDDPIDFGGRFGHWSVWLQGWKDEPGGKSILSTDNLFHTKRETMDWCDKHFPGVPVLYTTEARRK